MAEHTQDQLMTVGDVIAAMGISRSTWQKLVAQKRTPPHCADWRGPTDQAGRIRGMARPARKRGGREYLRKTPVFDLATRYSDEIAENPFFQRVLRPPARPCPIGREAKPASVPSRAAQREGKAHAVP